MPFGEEPEDLDNLTESCALDIADRGPVTLEYIASVQAITRERVRQIELTAIDNMQRALAELMSDDDTLGRNAKELLKTYDEEARAGAEEIIRLRNKSQSHKCSVVSWLSNSGSPPVD